ncbi:hypothetical protein [Picosynechococcus sp. NKBG15041c]|uniref:hypothetical protein n=1 Tax=Picosynechococcus sp. NKBG15041c TaxID=1407650 RepID=UPI000465412A|nr:hypothetical protein [Picosynechococcus sp. NKBG15041c]
MTHSSIVLTGDRLLDPHQRPTAPELINQLLALEKIAKREKCVYPFAALTGNWRLVFITGTKKAQKQAGKVLGKGRYLPNWAKVAIAYESLPNQELHSVWERGKVRNFVQLGPGQLSFAGPLKFQGVKRLLAFDFTHLTLKLGPLKLYQGPVRGGAQDEAFYTGAIAQQAFFSYFYVGTDVIAARGRGGGLAVWVRQPES